MASTWNVDARDTVARPSRVDTGTTARLRRRVTTTRNDSNPTAMGNDSDATATRPPDDGAVQSTGGHG